MDKLHKRHAKWKSCFVVMTNGDTVLGKVRNEDDYSTSTGAFPTGDLLFAKVDDEEINLPLPTFKELDISGESIEYTKYITTDSPALQAGVLMSHLYRVIVDGKCMLVLDEQLREGTSGAGVPRDRYYTYYKGILTKLHTEDFINSSKDFIKNSSDVFKECTEIVQKIANKTYGPNDLRKIVKEFNQYLAEQKK